MAILPNLFVMQNALGMMACLNTLKSLQGECRPSRDKRGIITRTELQCLQHNTNGTIRETVPLLSFTFKETNTQNTPCNSIIIKQSKPSKQNIYFHKWNPL